MTQELTDAISEAIVSGTQIRAFCAAYFVIGLLLLVFALRRRRKPRTRTLQLPAALQFLISLVICAISAAHLAYQTASAGRQATDLSAAAQAGELVYCPGLCHQTREGAWRVERAPQLGDLVTFIIVPHDGKGPQQARLVASPAIAAHVVEAIERRGYQVARPFGQTTVPDSAVRAVPADSK
ncbi:MAG: hypothetical protein ACJ74Q_15980 [Pyrinomonadaceae bacterium]